MENSLYSSQCLPLSLVLAVKTYLPQNDAMPHAVPLMGAAKASGVQPYKTALKIVWKKLDWTSVLPAWWIISKTYYSITLRPMFDAGLLSVAKMKRLTAIRVDDRIMVICRPPRIRSYR